MTSYRSVHESLQMVRGRATDQPCMKCGDTERRHHWAYQYNAGPDERLSSSGSTKGRLFSVNLDHYAPMCTSCHKVFDREHEPRIRENVSAAAKVSAARPKTQEHVDRIWESRRNRVASDPDFAASMRGKNATRMTRTNTARYRCDDCGYENNAGNLGQHRKASGHENRSVVI